MTDKKKTLSLPNKLKLTKTTVEQGSVHQTFPHGKLNTVAVEVKRKKTFAIKDGELQEVQSAKKVAESPETAQDTAEDTTNTETSSAQNLTDNEQNVRLRALQRAKESGEDDLLAAQPKLAKPKKAAVKEEAVTKEEEMEVSSKAEASPEEIAASMAEAEAVQPAPVATPAKKEKEKETKHKKKTKSGNDDEDYSKRQKGKNVRTLRLQAKMEEEGRMRSMSAIRRAREKAKRQELGLSEQKEAEKIIREVIVPETITVQELANRMATRSADVVKELMKLGMMVTSTQIIDADTAELVVDAFGHNIKRISESDVEDILETAPDKEEDLIPRSPVVTVMGHVDHGKTSLLDALRSTDVVDGEAGGITQHIGAYRVQLGDDKAITFVDTPGHEAFTAMRSRGAEITDIVVLVVAADDGIMAQTKEAISHAKAANVPIIVAINKIDKPDANPKRVRDELLANDLIPEDLGGDIIVVEVSAKEKTNLDVLEEAILLQAEVLELKANPNRSASGVVLEARVDRGRGVVATLLVQNGTLRIGNIIVAGETEGKVRAIVDDKEQHLKEALPTVPVEILGLNDAPTAGDPFSVVKSEKQARDITEYRTKRAKDLRAASTKHSSLDQLFAQASEGGLTELPLIVKGDVQGSLEAIAGSLEKLSNDEVGVKILHSGVGGITSSDVALAQASNTIIVGFNVRANTQVKNLAEEEGVDIRYYSIIYDLVDDVKAIISGMLKPIIREEYIGRTEVRDVFNITKVGKVAGCYVNDGMIKRSTKVRLIRDDIVIHEGMLKTLKRFKDEVKEVGNGYECGIALENYDDIKVGDIIESFEVIEEKQTL